MREIQLLNGGVTQIDDEDFPFLSRLPWKRVERKGQRYAMCGRLAMHRLILNLKDPSILVDHKDHDGLNNQKENLRTATNSQNQGNRRKRSNTSSKYKGVCWHKRWNVWVASIKVNQKTKYLGGFKTEEEAASAYDEAAKAAFGEFANPNFIH